MFRRLFQRHPADDPAQLRRLQLRGEKLLTELVHAAAIEPDPQRAGELATHAENVRLILADVGRRAELLLGETQQD